MGSLAVVLVIAAGAGCGSTFTRKPVDYPREQLADQLTNPHSVVVRLEVMAASRVVTVSATQSAVCDVLKQRRHEVGDQVYRDGEPVEAYTQMRVVASVESANIPCNSGWASNVRVELEAGGQRVWLGNTDGSGQLSADLADLIGAHNGISIPSGVTAGTLWAGGAPQAQVSLQDWWRFELEYEADLGAAETTLNRVLAADATTLASAARAVEEIQLKNPRTLRDRRLTPVLDGLDKRMQKIGTAQSTPPALPRPKDASSELSLSALVELGWQVGASMLTSLGAFAGDALAWVVGVMKEHPSEVCSAAQGVAVSILAGKIDRRVGAAFPGLAPLLDKAAVFGWAPSAVVLVLVKYGLGETRTAAVDTWIHRKCEHLVQALPSP